MADDQEWSEQRLAVTYEEARTVLDAQQRTLSDLDDKAMRTVRLTAVLLGVLASAMQLTTTTLHHGLGVLGVGSLLGSVVVGVEAYNESNTVLGPSNEYLVQLLEDEVEGTDWEEDIIRTYGGFIATNATEIRANSVIFRVQQLLFVLGLVLVALAITI